MIKFFLNTITEKNTILDFNEKSYAEILPFNNPHQTGLAPMHQKGTDFIKEPAIRAKLDNINEQVSQYKSVSYDSKGVIIDKLKDIIETNDLVTQGKVINKKNPLTENLIIKDSSEIVD